MLFARRRSLTFLLAAGYLLAVSAAGLFHDHGLGGCGSCEEHDHGCLAAPGHPTRAGADLHEDAGAKLPDGGSPDRRPADDRHCPVCRYLAQKPAAVHAACEVASAERREEAVWAAPVRFVAPLPLIWHSRAPPHVA